jgi:hypothetical protein
MGIWTIPFILVVGIIILISVSGVRKVEKAKVISLNEVDRIPESMEKHPLTFNPVIWAILVAAVFIGIMIFYYATSS